MIRSGSVTLLLSVGLALLLLGDRPSSAENGTADQPTDGNPPPVSTPATPTPEETLFHDRIEPLLKTHCYRCHNADNMKSGVRVDQLAPIPADRQLFLLKGIQSQVADGAMPPAEEPQPTDAERKLLDDWIEQTLIASRKRDTQKNGSIRRLTVSQYRNTLRDLLGIQEDLTDTLPPDGVSKDGFTNNAQTLLLSPLQVETCFDIAEQALDLCIVDEEQPPVIQTFRMDFGTAINSAPCPDNLILGANSLLLNNSDFTVTELQPQKPFPYTPFVMRKAYDFIEGYAGNDTVRGWKKYDSIYHSVFACMRGSPGYPKGEPYETVPTGLLLRPALPSYPADEVPGQPNRYGPMANFKISLRELPSSGNFRVTVHAARYEDALLLDQGSAPQDHAVALAVTPAELAATPEKKLTLSEPGIYQVDLDCSPGDSQGLLSLTLGERHFRGKLLEAQPDPALPPEAPRLTPFLLVRLPAGELNLAAKYGDNARLRRILFTRLPDDSDLALRFVRFEQRAPSLGVSLGLRRDCGSTLTPVAAPIPVPNSDFQPFAFTGAGRDYPSPEVELDNVNYLAGIREIGVRCEATDARDVPRLLIRSIEFEGPFHEVWPPAPHRRIFLDSPHASDPPAYAAEIIRNFAARAFRRPATEAEVAPLLAVWQQSFSANGNFRQSMKDALLVVLTSPQFLFLIENSATPDPEDLDPYELASKLSYFLWNAPPDQRLLDLAARNSLHSSLHEEVDRLILDPRFGQFVDEFAAQWLSLDKCDVVAVDPKLYPHLTRETKAQLREEPVHFLRYLIEQNLPLHNLIRSDFIVANEIVAGYYNLADRSESGFRFLPVKHDNPHLGGLLTQSAILAGLSDGRESNPVKRGAWFARKIIADPPDDPPPNVPQLPKDDPAHLTLRQKLEQHRNQSGCAKCHSGIDPWGIPFEAFDASGRLKNNDTGTDPRSTLPDGTEVADLNALKDYLVGDQIRQVAFSFLKHTACYATGRSLTYNEIEFLRERSLKMQAEDYRMKNMLSFIIQSDLFLKK